MLQTTLSDTGFDRCSKKTRKERFLDDMDKIIPWKELAEAIEPFYPKPKGVGRRPIGIERMLRIHFLQHWFNLSDPVAEEALYDSLAMRRFVGIDLGRESAPDEITICKFRHPMEWHNLGDHLFGLVNVYLAENGLKVNRKKERDPEMRSTRKGRQWHFGMKAHIGVDSGSKLIHSVVATPANVHDSQVLPDLLHGDETRAWGGLCLYRPEDRALGGGAGGAGFHCTRICGSFSCRCAKMLCKASSPWKPTRYSVCSATVRGTRGTG